MQKKVFKFIHFNDSYQIERTPQFLEQLNRYRKDALLIFSGDIFFPSLISQFEKGKQMLEFMKQAKIDIGILGNHDFDNGVKHCANLISELDTTWIFSNLLLENNQPICGSLPYLIKNINGMKIGIMGIVDHQYVSTCWFEDEKIVLEDEIKKAEEMVQLFQQNDCDLIIALTHILNNHDCNLLQKVKGIDISLGGHEHCYYIKKFQDNLCIKSGSNFESFNVVEVSIGDKEKQYSQQNNHYIESVVKFGKTDPKNFNFQLNKRNRFIDINIQQVPIDHTVNIESDFANYVKELNDKINEKFQIPMLQFVPSMNLISGNLRRKENLMGMFLSDLALSELDVDIVLLAGGHIRSEQVYPENYSFTLKDLLIMLPYTEPLMIAQTTGKRLRQFLNDAYQTLPGAQGGFLHPSKYFRVQIDVNKEKNKVKKMYLKGEEIKDDTEIKIASHLFLMLEGGDGFAKFDESQILNRDEKGNSAQDIFKRFCKLTEIKQYCKEFQVFKELNFDLMILFNRTIESTNEIQYLEREHLKLSYEQIRKKVDKECLQRLRFYSLASDIVFVGDKKVFEISDFDNGRLEMFT